MSQTLVITRQQRQLPDLLSIAEAGRLRQAVPGIGYWAALGIDYGAGLRVP
ncbi:hypothetical protein [Devosia sp. Leaf64]|uniref:hypothetical protein n=1 Tax=Devosia sp. Leaf64 TaxID=1736229 RepID=UPI0012E1A350|nr:hypothetical protein [Devosia sp. Leaf64]